MYKKWWWKILGVLLVGYALVAGLLIPLGPGITGVTPKRIEMGQRVKIDISSYNTRLKEEGNQVMAWLKYDDLFMIPAQEIIVNTHNQFICGFDMPRHLPGKDQIAALTLIVNSKVDGSMVLPSAVFAKQDSVATGLGKMQWHPVSEIKVDLTENLHFPFRNILVETIRNTFYHITLWFAMFILLGASVVYGIKYLTSSKLSDDDIGSSLVQVGLLYGTLGILTGMVWARFTWGTFWTTDIKLNMTAVAMLIYYAYLVLRMSITDDHKRARLSAAYNIFAFAALIPLVFIVPRMTDSLHPGNGGNPALGGEDLDNTLRMVFYPAIIGMTLLGLWIAEISTRIKRLRRRSINMSSHS